MDLTYSLSKKASSYLLLRKQVQLEESKYQNYSPRRMESLGILTSGIAHDFNNILHNVQGRTTLMRTCMDGSHPHVEHLTAIEDYLHSAKELINQLLCFARGEKNVVGLIDLNELIQKAATMFGRIRKVSQYNLRLCKIPL